WQNSAEVQDTLKAWLIANGYMIRNGVLEIFPSGNGLRFPLQSGFAWLAADGQISERREDLTTEQARSKFLNDVRENTNDWTNARKLIHSQLEAIDRTRRGDALAHEDRVSTTGFEPLFGYRLIPEKYQDGRKYWQTGLTAAGQRHDAILAVEHYLWHGDESADVPALPGTANDRVRFELIRVWLQQKHNGHCNHIRRGNWYKVEAQIKRAVVWRRSTGSVPRQPYADTERAIDRLIGLYKATGRVWTMEDFRKGNEGRRETARTKIKQAYDLLTSQGRRVTLRQLMRLSGCNHHTVRRHCDIWQTSNRSIQSVASDLNSLFDLDLLGAGGSLLERPEENFPSSPFDADSGDLVVLPTTFQNKFPSEPDSTSRLERLDRLEHRGSEEKTRARTAVGSVQLALFVISQTSLQPQKQQTSLSVPAQSVVRPP
ncbi:MAG: hypothetical protein ACRDHZ_08435, partial [Ktedonobacteraceae bacterium]